VTEGTAR